VAVTGLLGSGPPESRTRHLGIKSNFQTVAWCRFGLACRFFSRKRVVVCWSRLVALLKYEACFEACPENCDGSANLSFRIAVAPQPGVQARDSGESGY